MIIYNVPKIYTLNFEIFYKNIEERVEVIDNKPKRGRPRKKKQYFDSDTENAIIAYNNEDDSSLRNKVYNEYIHKALLKMTESLVHRFKFYHFDTSTKVT